MLICLMKWFFFFFVGLPVTVGCPLCPARFSQGGHLKEHLKTHSKEKPHKCTVCVSSFTLSGDLKVHMRVHSDESSFKCTVCHASFSQPGLLKSHMGIHSGEKPFNMFKCTMCPSNFSQPECLKHHMKTHFGVKPFKCTVCPLRFSLSGHLSAMRELTVVISHSNVQCVPHILVGLNVYSVTWEIILAQILSNVQCVL